MFEIPGSDICSVEIDGDVVAGNSQPKYHRGSPLSAAETSGQDDYDTGANANRAVNN